MAKLMEHQPREDDEAAKEINTSKPLCANDLGVREKCREKSHRNKIGKERPYMTQSAQPLMSGHHRFGQDCGCFVYPNIDGEAKQN